MEERDADAVIRLGKLVLEFARVDRATAMEDGVTPESDTDHTVMLGVIACAFAAKHEPAMDLGKIAQFAFVHDLVEVYAGDTNTFGMSAHLKQGDKEERERAALNRIKKEFDQTLPWVSSTIEEYDSLDSREARYIRTLDKILPKITNVLNKARRLRAHGGVAEFSSFCEAQLASLRDSYGHDQDATLELYGHLTVAVEKNL
jgi:putative hydrolase of HD superfamily